MDLDEQVALLMQGTDYGDETLKASMARELRERLAEGRPLRVYCGYDPTSKDLHLGHTITMRKLRQFQDLGHEVTFLIGSYTALVGDPSDKNKARPCSLIATQIFDAVATDGPVASAACWSSARATCSMCISFARSRKASSNDFTYASP